MAIRIKGYNELLGNMIRKIIAETPVNDVNTASVILSLMEAAASNDFENNVAILNVLELLNIDALKNNDLDARASELGLERKIAIKASGFIKIDDTTISPRKTVLYPVKPAPIRGQNVIYVTNAGTWNNTGGQLYIGRGTSNFEGPINYTSIDDFGTFYAINLASSLEKDHLISEEVIDGQGTTDRLIASGTVVKTPSNNIEPEILYRTLRDAVIPAGENTVTDIPVLAVRPGSAGNAGIDTITIFDLIPFPGAKVSNINAFTNGRDVESDEDFRERIKAYANSLARGTRNAILSAIIGISDTEESKQVESAVITEPLANGEPSIVYIDDGSGFQPSTRGQSVDILLDEANGSEEFLQLARFPLPRPQLINNVDGPYPLTDGAQLRVLIDDIQEVIQFNASDFDSIANARASEIVIAINNKAESFAARLDQNSNRVLLYPASFNAETIKIITEGNFVNANSALKFPINESSYIALYQNNKRLRSQERAATLQTLSYASWAIVGPGNLVIAVDDTPAQDRSFDVSDFGNTPFNALTLSDWVRVFNRKFAGITAFETPAGNMVLRSNREGSESRLQILGGTYFSRLFNDLPVTAEGQNSDFKLNRQNGNVRILTDIVQGDTIQAGSDDTKGSVISNIAQDGTFNVSLDAVNRPTNLIIVADAKRVVPRNVILPVQGLLTLQDMGSHIMRLLGPTTTAFRDVQPGDFIYIVNRGDNDGSGNGLWIDIASCGLFKVVAKGGHTNDGVDTWLDVENKDMVIGTPADTLIPGAYLIKDANDVQAFYSDAYPQIWNGASVTNPPAEPIEGIVESINSTLENVKASIFRTNQIKVTSTTEEGGSIAMPVITGNGRLIFAEAVGHAEGEFSHIANLRPNKDFLTWFQRTQPESTNVFLNRYVYRDVKGSIDDDVSPGDAGVDPYSEVLTDAGVLNDQNINYDNYVHIIDKSNKGIFRAIKQILPGDSIGTRHDRPRSLMDFLAGTRYHISRTHEFSDNDNLVAIMDGDPIAKTVDIKFARLGQVNSGSNAGIFIPTNLAFSGNDADNEPGIDFGNVQVWGTTLNNTNFNDYAVWFQARNWYVSGGVGSGGPALMIRAKDFGPSGEKLRFALDYPEFANNPGTVTLINKPDFSTLTYFFGSGPEIPINIQSGDVINITDQGGYVFRYTFPATVDLSSVQIGNVIVFGRDSGLSIPNRGAFRVLDVNDAGKYIDLYNPNGQVPPVGTAEETELTTVDDIAPFAAQHEVEITEDGSAIHLKYIVLFLPNGDGIAFWFNNSGGPEVPPSIPGISIYEEVVVGAGDTTSQVNAALQAIIDARAEFDATIPGPGDMIVVDNTSTGPVNLPTVDGSLSATVTQVSAGSNGNSYDGKYFIVFDDVGSVAFWIDLDNNGTSEPAHGAARSVKIDTIVTGDLQNDIATKIATAVNADLKFSASAVGNVVTIVNDSNGQRSAPVIGTMPTGVTLVVSVPGVDDVIETVAIPTSVRVFTIINNSATEIAQALNDGLILSAVVVNSGNFEKATRDETYTPAGPTDWSASLSYGHDPDPVNENYRSIGLYDSESWVLTFTNTNPNFTLKRPLLLTNVAPSIYQIDTTINPDTTTGEYFKLIPRTLENVLHHLTQKALSQLQIISSVEIANSHQKIQIKSLKLGSEGAIEAIGGRANGESFPIIGDAQRSISDIDGAPYLEVKIPSFPVTLSAGQFVKLENPAGAERLSRLNLNDSISVIKIDDETYEYRYDDKEVDLNRHVKFTIQDVSALYGRAGTGSVWRWQFSNSGSLISITDKLAGVVAVAPAHLQSDGLASSAGLFLQITQVGTVSNALSFNLTVEGTLNQGDHVIFETSAGVKYALWISVDGDNTAPTSAQFAAATNKIRVNVLSSNDDNTNVSAIASALLTFGLFTGDWSLQQTLGANLNGVVPGDMLIATGTLSGWAATNKTEVGGEEEWAGYPIIAVDEVLRHIDIINPNGVVMGSATPVGAGSKVSILPSPALRWRVRHYARPRIVQVVVVSNEATLVTNIPHQLNIGDQFIVQHNNAIPSTPGLVGDDYIATVTEVVGPNTVKYDTDLSVTDGAYVGGLIKAVLNDVTKYRVEKLGYRDLFRLQYVSGRAPMFETMGVAIDDLMIIKGNTFFANNAGTFRVLAVDDESIIFQNSGGKEQLDDLRNFNDLGQIVSWQNSSPAVTGPAGAFINVKVGDWVKKFEDEDTLYRQVISFDTNDAATATQMVLGGTYQGSTSDGLGVAFDQEVGVNAGVSLDSTSDIVFMEGDSVRTRDKLFVSETANQAWFNVNNSGNFDIISVGTNLTDYRPYLRVRNVKGVAEIERSIATPNSKFTIMENDDHRFSSVKRIEHVVLDEFDPLRRIVYMTPPDRIYKFTQTNKTMVTPIGKLGYPIDIVKGVDGYTYYTGLLRKVQRIIDGYEPDAQNFPGRKAVGGVIEILPPLIQRVKIALDVTTKEGVNLNEITNEIKSTIIQYVNTLGVGQDVILSDIIVRVKGIEGVEAVTFIIPDPSQERVSIADNERAFVEPRDISIA